MKIHYLLKNQGKKANNNLTIYIVKYILNGIEIVDMQVSE